jgi:hypothetical protein
MTAASAAMAIPNIGSPRPTGGVVPAEWVAQWQRNTLTREGMYYLSRKLILASVTLILVYAEHPAARRCQDYQASIFVIKRAGVHDNTATSSGSQ